MAAISLTFTARQRHPMSWGVDQSRRKCTPSSCVSVVKRRSISAVERSTAQSSPIPRTSCAGAVCCRRCCKRAISANSPSSPINIVVRELAHGALAHGALAHGALAHGALAHGALAHRALAHKEIQDAVRYEDRLDDRLVSNMAAQLVIRQGGSLHHVGSTIGSHCHCATYLPINLHGHCNLTPMRQRFIIGRIALREDGRSLPQTFP